MKKRKYKEERIPWEVRLTIRVMTFLGRDAI